VPRSQHQEEPAGRGGRGPGITLCSEKKQPPFRCFPQGKKGDKSRKKKKKKRITSISLNNNKVDPSFLAGKEDRVKKGKTRWPWRKRGNRTPVLALPQLRGKKVQKKRERWHAVYSRLVKKKGPGHLRLSSLNKKKDVKKRNEEEKGNGESAFGPPRACRQRSRPPLLMNFPPWEGEVKK